MAIKTMDIYVCDKCSYEDTDSEKFRTFIGNVRSPDGGGFIDNNILHDQEAENWMIEHGTKDHKETGYVDSLYRDNKAGLVIKSNDYCLDCIKTLLRLNSK